MTSLRTAPRRVAAAVPLALVALALLAPAAGAQTDVGISGTVRNATTDEPLADASVQIAYFDGAGQVTTAKTTTDTEGAFAVTPPAGSTGYQVAVDHDGAEFRSIATELLPGQPSVAAIDVYDTTTDPKSVELTDWIVWVDADEGTGGWNVQQDFGWTNKGKTAYVGEDGATVTVPLAAGANNLQFLGTFLEQQGDVVDGSYVSAAPIIPGQTSATIFYATQDLPDLTLPVTFEVGLLQVFVPMGLQAQGAGLRLAGTQSDQGVTYQVYTADVLTPGQDLQIVLSEGAAPEPESDATTYLLIGVALLAAIAAGAFFIVGRRRSRPAPKGGPKKARPAQPQPRPKASRQTDTDTVRTRQADGHRATAPAATDDVDDDDEVQLLIDEIAALDLSFEKGLIEERAYRRLRVAAKDRLLLAQEARAGTRSPR